MTRRMFLTAAGVTPSALFAKLPYPDWDAEFRDRLLTDSPWAKQLTVKFDRVFSGGWGMPVRTEIYLIVRWSSALPVRQALALELWGREGLRSSEAERFVNEEQPEYVVTVSGFPATTVDQGARRLEAELARTARLYFKGRPLSAAAAYVPEHGNHLSSELRFARIEGIQPEDGIIEFAAEAGPIKIAQKFKLKEMVYNGRLEL